jgi:predicted ATP-dependent endonuclease of OLD family
MDLNVIIGPNNYGKTSILRAIDLLQRIGFGRYSGSFDCKTCESFFGSTESLLSLSGEITDRERFLNKYNPRIIFTFDIEEIERTLPYLTKERDETLSGALSPSETEIHDKIGEIRNQIEQFKKTKDLRTIQQINDLERMVASNEAELQVRGHVRKDFPEPKIVLKQIQDKRLGTEHVSFLFNRKFMEDVLRTMIFCPDARLDIYKGANVPDYIRSKNLPTSEQTVMVQFLKDFVDLKLVDMRQNMDLIRIVEGTRFDTTIAEQGSGVKSLICLVADILAGAKNKILLIDEPELGLNPSGKQAFLKFLLGQSREKQIFIATHDPTFVNPLIWGNLGVSVYVYSVAESKFVKVNLEESKTDPSTFAGYLPHTTSLKQVHIYVEGSRDVYIFQIFLERYVKENFENWYEIINRIGIYHLAGDFWSHLLYTIPEKPYFSIVVLDGDKKKLASDVLKKHDAIKKNRFRFFSSISEMKKLSHRYKTLEKDTPFPVICLQRAEIEDYLEPKPASKEHGPLVAQQMKYVPEEIAQIFSVTFKFAGIESPREHKLQQTMP